MLAKFFAEKYDQLFLMLAAVAGAKRMTSLQLAYEVAEAWDLDIPDFGVLDPRITPEIAFCLGVAVQMFPYPV